MKLSKQELEAVIAASPRSFVPFNKLVLSPTYQARPENLAAPLLLTELAASIEAAGLLHNLIVVRGARGVHEVCAGGRRLRAMALLVEQGRWAENQPVPVLVVPAEQALMASLIENVEREALNPADEFAAFARLIDGGRSVEDVAAAFGVTPQVVKRRLKLAAVSPALLKLFREGGIGLDCLMVLASLDDPARQEQLWQQLPEWNRSADQLRRLLTRGEVESDRDGAAIFVTAAAYEAAGGPLRRDLFSDDGKAYLQDAALLERLALDKLQQPAREVAAEGWKWVEVRARYVYEDYVRHGEVRRARRAPNADEAARHAQLEAELETLHARMEALSDDDGDENEYAALEADDERLQAELNALDEALAVFPADLVAQAGCVVFVGSRGTVEVKRGLVRPEDRDAVVQAARQATSGEPTTGTALVSLPKGGARAVHSEKLMRSLTAHRVAAIQAELLLRPDVALAALTAHLAAKLLKDGFHRYRGGDDALTVSASETHEGLRRESADMAEAEAWKLMEQTRIEWTARLPGDGAALLPWLLAQERQTVIGLLTFLVAASVNGVEGAERERQSTDALAEALALDMRRWWKASAASYFNHVSKATTLAAVTEAAGANAAAPLAGLKKDGAAAGAEQALSAAGWLPQCLRTPPQRSETDRARLDGGDMQAASGGEPHGEQTLDEGAR
ncbi:MAG: ParB N-terminal domain-containing protein [Piscinibacter sp.]|uniref:ParB/RepB/Spo0J family partition protein n=1 Tax=Piscinibacter TaxID=1114981 RepID=UPI000FDEAE5A|nr:MULTISPECIES: ParB/RepB/Spo0J family partition protein [Piscinibacter]MCW5663896.1 ParB N-terminal domain-containing protein [Piscinibacter sp.]